MYLKKALSENIHILEVEEVDFTAHFKTLSPAIRKKSAELLSLVYVFKIKYKVNKKRIIGYVSIPRKGKNLPCVIHLRGGSREFGMLTLPSIFGQLVRFSAEGYIVIATQYPGIEGGDGIDTFGGEDDIECIKKLREILKSIPSADLDKIGLKGHSRGGLMAYMLLREVKWIKCAVIAGAPTDQISKAREREGWKEHQIKMWGREKKDYVKRSPIFWVEELPKNVPILLMHGSADWRVLPIHSTKMSMRFLELAIPHRFILFEGADHGISEYREEYNIQTLNWFNRYLKKDEGLPNLIPHGD